MSERGQPKPTLKTTLASCFLLLSGAVSLAQRGDDVGTATAPDQTLLHDGRAGYAWQTRTHSLTGQFGLGWLGMVRDLNVSEGVGQDDAFSITTDVVSGPRYEYAFSGGPAATLAYDYRFGRVFSLGAAVGYQRNRLDDIAYAGGSETVRTTDDVYVSRTFVSGRTLFHYGRAANFELYSGVRFGATLYRRTGEGAMAEAYVQDKGERYGLPHVSVIPFGFRGFVGSNVSLGAEVMTGSPHVVAAQVGYRF